MVVISANLGPTDVFLILTNMTCAQKNDKEKNEKNDNVILIAFLDKLFW